MKAPVVWGIVSIPLISVGVLAYQYWPRTPAPAAPVAEEPPRTIVELHEAKLAAAGLHATSIGVRQLRQVRTVPGKIDYDSVRRVELKAPVDSVVQKVLVKPGDAVDRGTRLALLDSPEIGLVRAEVERNRAELAAAQQSFEWHDVVTKNLTELLKTLRTRPKAREVERQYEGKLLGDHRQHVLAAYAKYSLAEDLWNETERAAKTGAVAETLILQRESARDIALEEFRGVGEQSQYDSLKDQRKSKAVRDDAERLLHVSQQKLRTLLGAFSEVVEVSENEMTDNRDLTRYYLISPIAGTVQQRDAADQQRLAAGMLLYVVANTDGLWVTADIRERDWQALTLRAGEDISVRVPALGNREFNARMNYIGGAVSPDTLAVPLIADVANPEGLLKPGMFVWVSLPLVTVNEAIAVPVSAIMMHEGQRFVFVQDAPRTFRRVDITTGLETPEWVAVTHGLNGTEKIIDHGAFLLKSELLLEAEE